MTVPAPTRHRGWVSTGSRNTAAAYTAPQAAQIPNRSRRNGVPARVAVVISSR